MALFGKQFFKGKSSSSEDAYRAGVHALERQDFKAAQDHFTVATNEGHVSAFYNLFSIHGGGCLSPYNIDRAADCWYKAADLGHPVAQEQLFMLEAADRGGFGVDNLARFASLPAAPGFLSPFLMTSACRFLSALCNRYGAVSDVIAYELDAASESDEPMVRAFVSRTGVSSDFFRGGLNRLEQGASADQITDGLNTLTVAMMQEGIDRDLCLMARCTIIGFLTMKSHLGERSRPLLGVRDFLDAA